MLLFLITVDADAQQARPAPASKVPMTLVPCLPNGGDVTLASQAGEPVVCWGTTCMKLASDELAAMVPVPPRKPTWLGPVAEVRAAGGKPSHRGSSPSVSASA